MPTFLVGNMKVTSEIKQDIAKEFGGTGVNTGKAEVQIAIFTKRIEHLTFHLKTNRKDFSAERNLIKLVGKRRALLDYIAKNDIFRYRDIIKQLGLRK